MALGVVQSEWGRGVGSALLARVLEWSREAGLARVERAVHTANTRAIGLSLRSGFQIEGTRRRSLPISGRYVDDYLMSVLNDE